jgi:hypothetical protein
MRKLKVRSRIGWRAGKCKSSAVIEYSVYSEDGMSADKELGGSARWDSAGWEQIQRDIQDACGLTYAFTLWMQAGYMSCLGQRIVIRVSRQAMRWEEHTCYFLKNPCCRLDLETRFCWLNSWKLLSVFLWFTLRFKQRWSDCQPNFFNHLLCFATTHPVM